jgi:transcription initiation factor TFIID subunit 6
VTDKSGLLSTLTSALESSPFPSPLGATNPPAGRYEGAVLAISALGPAAVRQAIWRNGKGLERINTLVDTLYLGEGQKRRNSLVKASLVSNTTLGVLCTRSSRLRRKPLSR